MTTFEMALEAWKNPDKIFVGFNKEQDFEMRVQWEGNRLRYLNGMEFDVQAGQCAGYQWKEWREARKWNGEYLRWVGKEDLAGGDPVKREIPEGVAVRVKWEAEEVLD